MAIEQVPLNQIDDNPFNPRKYYNQNKVREMASSLREGGLRQTPEGRRINGKVQIAYGHVRKRAYLLNQKKDPEIWKEMPVDVKEISDENMFHYAWEENVRRTDITQIELARCIQSFKEMFPDIEDKDIGAKHSMSAESVSNMRRVLRLPQRFLEKIDTGVMSFSQGRTLLTLEGLPEADSLMTEALSGLRTGNKSYGEADTVDGLIKSIHNVIDRHFPPLDKAFANYHYDLVFNTREAGCLECKKMVRTHPTKSTTAHYCTDEKCWLEKQAEHRAKAAAAAKEKVKSEVIQRAAETIVQEEKEAPPAPEPAPAPTPVSIDENTILVDQETLDKLEASCSCGPISEDKSVHKPVYIEEKLYLATSAMHGEDRDEVEAYVMVPRAEFKGEVRTYKAPADRDYEEYFESLRNDPNGFYHSMLVKRGKQEFVLVGPEVTFVNKIDTEVDKGDFSREKSPGEVEVADETDRFMEKVAEESEAQARERERAMEEAREKANLERPVGIVPCETCDRSIVCDRSFFRVADDDSGRYVCDQWEPPEEAPAPIETPAAEIPEEVLQKAEAAAGTRAEVLDMVDISTGNQWSRQMKSGYAILSRELSGIDDPDECIKRCTHGFHYAFDSKAREQEEIFICSDPKCLAKKKGALTRKRNAEGHARKNAEKEAIKQVLDQMGQVVEKAEEHIRGIMAVAGIKTPVIAITRPVLQLIIYNQLHGSNVARFYYGDRGKEPVKWLWEKLSPGITQDKRKEPDLWKLIDKLSDADLVKLVVEMMFAYLTDTGDVASHEIKTVEPLALFGVAVNDAIDKKEKQHVEA